jgi:ADP-heptose:LPS heptosyltransferase
MIPRYSNQPVAFTPADCAVVVDACRQLYALPDPEAPEPPTGIGNAIRGWFFQLLGAGAGRTDGLEEARRTGRPVRVLVFRYDAVGDYIVTSPFVRWMHENMPGVEIDVVGSTRNAGLLSRDPFISEVVAINPNHPPHPSWFRVRAHAQRRPPDVVAALVFTRMTKAAILTGFAGKQARRVTIMHDTRRDLYGKVFDVQVPHHIASEHWMDTMAKVGPATFGGPPSEAEPYIVLENRAILTTVHRLVSHGVGYHLQANSGLVAAKGDKLPVVEHEGRPYVVVNVSAFSPNRQWNMEQACQVAARIAAERPGTICYVTGGPDASTRLRIAINRAGHSHVVQWSGTFSELTALIAGAALVITPDTAALHIAAVAKRKVVGLFAELIKVAEWFPYNTEYRAILSPDPNTIDAIGVDLITEQALNLFA